MCDVANHPWQFDGNLIYCPDCKREFRSSVSWIEFVNEEKKHAEQAFADEAVKLTDAYLSHTLRGQTPRRQQG